MAFPPPSPPLPVAHNAASYLGALVRTMTRVTANADRDGVITALAGGLANEFGIAASGIGLYDPRGHAIALHTGGGLRVVHSSPPAVDAGTGQMAGPPLVIPLTVSDRALVQAVLHRTPIIIDDLRTDSRFSELKPLVEAGLTAYAAFPLCAGHRLIGAMIVAHDAAWPLPMLEALDGLAQQAALALDHARVLGESRTLQALATELASALDPESLLERLVERMTSVVGADAGVVWLLEGNEQRMAPRVSHGFSPGFFARVARYTAAPGAFADLQRNRSPLHFPDLPAVIRQRDPAAADAYQAEGIVSSLRLPLFEPDDRLIGLLALYHRRERRYGDDEVLLAQAFADQIAVAMHNARLMDQERAARAEAARQVERLTTLTGITAQLLSATGLDEVLNVVAEAAWRLSAARGGAIVGLFDPEQKTLTYGAFRGPIEDVVRDMFPLPGNAAAANPRPVAPLSADYLAHSATGQAIVSGRTVVAEDYRTWPPSAVRDNTIAANVLALCVAPLRVDGATIGVLIVNDSQPRQFAPDDVALIEALADQAALAITQARLVEDQRQARAQAERGLEHLRTLTDITQRLLAAADLDGVLQIVVEAAGRLCDASGAMIGLVDAQHHISAVAASGEPQAYFAHFTHQSTLETAFLAGTATNQAMSQRRAIVVEDYGAWGGGHRRQSETFRLGVRALVVAPLLVDDLPIGVLWVNDTIARPFAPDDVALVQALADQAALAIEHTRLLRRGQEAAVLEERARLARDLHDSVTQSVFSAGLMANAAVTQHARGAEALGSTLQRIKTVTHDALAEMRALLYELQPAALAEEGLAKALAKLVAAMQVRSDVPITFAGTARTRLSAAAETAIFRIVQESLSNVTKYAQATTVTVTLTEATGYLRAEVRDDGVGFDPSAPVSPSAGGRQGGMGLPGMRARAADAGLNLRVTSAPGAGTSITVEAPLS